MSGTESRFEDALELVRSLSREDQIRLFEALGLHGAPSKEERPAPEAGDEVVCGQCGALIAGERRPAECPRCGASSDQFVVEAED